MSKESELASAVAWKARNPEKVAAQKKRYAERYPERIREANKRWKKAHHEKHLAHKALERAVHRGSVEKLLECERCGKAETEGHHPNYEERFVVVWLCRECHKEIHK
jgi:ribosomal protein L37AE/L43A